GWIQTPHGVAGTPQSTIVTYRTTDGGKSWSAARFPAPPWIAGGGGIGGLTFVNPSVGWFTAGAAPATAQGLIAVYRTTDGGRSWTVISVGSTLGTSGGLPAATPHALPPLGGGQTTTLSPSVALATGSPYPDPTPVYLYRTTSGGATWYPASISLPVTVPVSSLGGTTTSPPVFSGSDGSLVLTLAYNSGLSRDAVYTTFDSGQSWQFSAFAPATAASFGEPLVDFESPDIGIALGPTGLFETTNAGRNWTRVQAPWLPALMHSLTNVVQVQMVGNKLFTLVRGPYMANGAAATVESYLLSPVSAIP
ncbi:MAG: WD40/YVTN/BNR-like repeat-containing protein, partial [Sulfobacillus sp.]